MPSYTDVTVSGYDSSPPVDDGTESEANRIKWSTIKTKLGDPLNTAVGSVDDNIAAAITTITSNMSTSTSNLASTTSTYSTVSVNIYAPSTTAAIFAMSAAPTGWTKAATHNNKALRLVSGGTGGSAGGSTAFTSVLGSRSITTAEMPAHSHTWSSGTLTCSMNRTTWTDSVSTGSSGTTDGGSDCIDDVDTNSDTMSASASIGSTASSQPSVSTSSTMDFAVRYMDVIIATKD